MAGLKKIQLSCCAGAFLGKCGAQKQSVGVSVDPRFDLARDLLGEVTPTRLKIPTLAKIVSRCYNKRT